MRLIVKVVLVQTLKSGSLVRGGFASSPASTLNYGLQCSSGQASFSQVM